MVACGVSTDGVAGNSDKLVRLANLRSLGLSPRELSGRVGGRETYWRDMLKGDKSFGERIARKAEEKLGLPRAWMDDAHAPGDAAPAAAPLRSDLSPSEWALIQDMRESLAEDQAFIREEAAARAKKFRELRLQIMAREGNAGSASAPTVARAAPPVASEQRQQARADLDALRKNAAAKRAAAEEAAARKTTTKKNRTS